MQITNDYASALDLFGTNSTADKTEKEQSRTTLSGSDGDSVTISNEARQLYARQSAAGETAAPASQGGGSAPSGGSASEDGNNSQIENQIQNVQGQLASLQSSDDSSSGEIAALQARIASLKAQLN